MNISVLHIITTLSGGPGNVLCNLIFETHQSVTHKIIVLDNDVEPEFSEKLNRMNIQIAIQEREKKIERRTINTVSNILMEFKPNAISTYDLASHFYAFVSLNKSKGVKWFPGVHGLIGSFKGWRGYAQKLFFRRANRAIVPSEAVKQKLVASNTLTSNKVIIIPNGITQAPTQIERQNLRSTVRLICVANFYSPVKGQKIAINALSNLPQNYNLTFVGEGYLLESAKFEVKELNLGDRVHFLGKRENNDARKLLSEYDVCIIPSLSESYGISAVEAMAAGLPTVATDVGGLPEIVLHGKTGYLVKPDDPLSISRAVLKITESTGEWFRMKEESLNRFSNNFSAETMAKAYMTEYVRT